MAKRVTKTRRKTKNKKFLSVQIVLNLKEHLLKFQENLAKFQEKEKQRFENDKATVFIRSESTFIDVLEDISPLLIDAETFVTVANKKNQISKVRKGT